MISSRKVWPALCFLSLTASLTAQRPAITLDAVLAHVRANIADYRTSVPNFACDESVDSQRLGDGKIKDETKVQSSFRITRTSPDGKLQETRIKNTVDGKPAKSQKVSLPYTFSGGFANMLGYLQNECTENRLGDPDPADAGKIILFFGPKPASVESPTCKLKSYQGKALIDPVSFQVSHLEYRQEDVDTGWVAHVPFVPIPSKHNVMTVAVDYAPVTLGDKIFWLPSQVGSTITDKSKPMIVRYDAAYSNYHRFTATVSISSPGKPSAP